MEKIILLITIILFISRISSTSRSLSRKVHDTNVLKIIERRKAIYSELNETEIETHECKVIILGIIFYAIILCYFLYNAYNFHNKLISFLSIVQAASIIWTFYLEISENPFSLKIEEHPFHRWYSLFNVILDYCYYIMLIYSFIV